jgi:hypothetical protein
LRGRVGGGILLGDSIFAVPHCSVVDVTDRMLV